MRQMGLNHHQCFDYHFSDLKVQLLHVHISARQVLPHKLERAFGPSCEIMASVHKFIAFFINRVVREVHEHILERGYSFVWLSRKPSQALFKQKNPKRLARSNQHIQPQVKFQSVYEIRSAEIPLDYHMRFGG